MRTKTTRRAVAVLIGLAVRVAAADEPACAPPAMLDDGWSVSTPAEAGFDAAALCAILAAVRSGADNIHGVVIERDGQLLAELYRRGPDQPINSLYGMWNPFAGETEFAPTTLHDVRSISKSVVGLLIGIARQNGEMTNLEAPALGFFPELAALRSPERERITLDSLLSMSSGLEWDEGALPNDETKLYWKSDPDEYVLSRPIVAPPGTVFNYNSGGTGVLADILVRTSGKPLCQLVGEQLFEPLGIRDWEWVSNLHGRELAFTGLRLRPRDLLKLGRLVVDGGQWDGRQLVPAEWIAESTRAHISTGFRSPPSAPYPLQYGYQWWTGFVDWNDEKVAWAAGFGNGGQRLFVVPRLGLAVAITAGDYGSMAIANAANGVFGRIVGAIRH